MMEELASPEGLAGQPGCRRRVAIIGSGRSGLVAARYLKYQRLISDLKNPPTDSQAKVFLEMALTSKRD
jgi:hypothetical protein